MKDEKHICKHCGNRFNGKFCNHCGEKVFTDHDKSVAHIFEEGFHFLTHFEGKFLVTLKTIVARPGKLSLDYCNGIRKKYFKPLSFFLLLVVLYLLFPVFDGLNMELRYHLNSGYYGKFAKTSITELMQNKHWTMEQVTEKFSVASSKTSKFLLLIIIPVMCLYNYLLLRKKRKMLFDHFIYAAETSSLFLLWWALILPLLYLVLKLIASPMGLGFWFENEAITGVLLLVPFLIYVWVSARRFYWLSRSIAFLHALFYSIVFTLFLLVIYKFLLFYLSVKMIH